MGMYVGHIPVNGLEACQRKILDEPEMWQGTGTHIWLDLTNFDEDKTIKVQFDYISANPFTVDFGDNTIVTIPANASIRRYTITHTYTNKSKYRIDIVGYDAIYLNNIAILDYSSIAYLRLVQNCVYQIESDVQFLSWNGNGGYCFTSHLYGIKFARFTHFASGFCNNIYGLVEKLYVSGDDIVNIGNCFNLEELHPAINGSQPNIGTFMYGKLKEHSIPSGVTTIGSWIFSYSYNLLKLIIPETVTTIGDAFCYTVDGVNVIMKPTTPPTIGTRAFGNGSASSPVKIYVPYSSDHSILDAYKAATNWSVFANLIYELDESGNIPSA